MLSKQFIRTFVLIVSISMLLAFVLVAAAMPAQSNGNKNIAFGPAIDMPIVESEHPYANDFNDFWTVEMPGAEATRIHFSRIELEENADYLIISDPSEKRTQVITGNYPDGLWTDPVPGAYVRIRLITDVNVRKWGFAIDQKEAVAYPSMLRSAHPYHNNTDETWTVLNTDPVPGEATRIHFSKIELEENVDWLILSDINGIPYQYITGSHPGGLWSIGVPGIAVKAQLITDGNVERWGFNIDATQSATLDAPVQFPEFTTILESDHPYANGENTTWTIMNPDPSATSTKVHFTRIKLGRYDYLDIFDANDNRIQLWRGATDQYDVWSDYVPGRIVKVRLRETDVEGGYWGFRIDRMVNGEDIKVWAQSDHPYANGENTTWTIVNPDPNATSTKVHFSRIKLGRYDYLDIFDASDNRIQLWRGATDQYDVWSDYVPGRIVKVRLRETDVEGGYWGFRIDDIYSTPADLFPPAAITGIYITVAHPGHIFLNDAEVAYAQLPGEYKVLLPGQGEHRIRIEYLDYTQDILVNMTERAANVIYLPIVEKAQ